MLMHHTIPRFQSISGGRIILTCLFLFVQAGSALSPNHLVLPPLIPVTVGVPFEIVYDNIVILDGVSSIEVICPVGEVSSESWSITPSQADFGIYPLTIQLLDENAELLEEAQTILAVNQPKSSTQDLRIMIIGDSLTNSGNYQQQLKARLDANSVAFSSIGTVLRGGMWCEGYGGNSYQRYLEGPHYDRSPFVYSDTGFDPARYFSEEMGGVAPTLYMIFLGINDTFSKSDLSEAGLEARIDEVIARADPFISGMRAAAPNSDEAIILTPAGSSEQGAFDAAYGAGTYYTQGGWHDMRLHLVNRYIEHYGGREAEGLYLIPVSVGLDRVADYSVTDPIHPNGSGYQKIGDIIFSWVNHYLDQGSYSRWAIESFESSEILAGLANKDLLSVHSGFPLSAHYWLDLPPEQATVQPFQWGAAGLTLSHRVGAPLAVEFSPDLVEWGPWTGASEVQEFNGFVQKLIRLEDMDTTGHTKHFWRVDIVTEE